MILAIDFDGVIHDMQNREKGRRMGKPVPGAPEALKTLFQDGHRIIVHSVKASTDSGYTAVVQWLDYFELGCYVSHVTAVKPQADAYIDDKAIHFSEWPLVLDLVAEWQENGS